MGTRGLLEPILAWGHAGVNFLLTCRATTAYSAGVTNQASQTEYRCPGQTYAISRSVHLGRLACFYPACRQCAHAADAAELSPRQGRRWAEVRSRSGSGPQFDQEGVAGVWHNELRPDVVGQIARALAAELRRAGHEGRGVAVVVGCDGGPLVAEATAAAIDAIRWTGCQAIDAGAVSAACLALAIDHWQAAGGLLVGNPLGRANTAGLKFWMGARPLSAGHGLERIQLAARQPIDRPARTYGAMERVEADEPYLTGLAEHFHGLRPLRIVLHTTCQPVERYFHELASSVACQVIPAVCARLGEAVSSRAAHFGIAIEDDGEVCHLVDEQGRAVPPDRLLLLVAGHRLAREPGARVVLEPDAPPSLAGRISRLGGQAVAGGPTRAAMEEAMRSRGAVLGGGWSGRLWHCCGPAVPDALRTLTCLLVLLSRSDRALSEVLDSEAPAG